MNRLRTALLIGIGAFVVVGAAACGSDDEPAAAPEATTAPTAVPATTAPAAPQVTIVDPWVRPGAMVTADDAMMDDGMTDDGMMDDGMTDDGMMDDGMTDDGMMDDGMSDDSMMDDGMAMDGMAGMSGSGTAAAYMTLVNSGDAADTLVAIKDLFVEAPGDTAEAVELHESSMDDQGVMAMQQVSGVPIPAGGTTEMKPGGFHVMILNLKRDVLPGDTLTMTLDFETGADQTITAVVREP